MRPRRLSVPVSFAVLALALLQVVGCGGCGKDKKVDPPLVKKTPESDEKSAVPLLVFDDQGAFTSPEVLDELKKQHAAAAPKEIFLLAHGWNNSLKDARESYADLRRLLIETAPEPKTAAGEFLVLGVRWPSKAYDEDEAWKAPFDTKKNQALFSALNTALPKKMSPSTYAEDLVKLEELLQADRPQDRLEMFEIFRKYSLEPSRTKLETSDKNDESIFAPGKGPKKVGDLQALGNIGKSGPDLVRVFTFWQMKALAGLVGEKGLRPVLRRLQEIFPEARFHLVGHSFGCKLLLAAVAIRADEDVLARPIDSMTLIQGALSHQACADRVTGTKLPGGYRIALDPKRVRGPIVATFTKKDVPLNVFYPYGSYLAGQVGELVHKYSALGAAGFDGVEARPMAAAGTAYDSFAGLVSIDANHHITGHGDYRKPEVAWLIWSSAGRK